MFPLAQFVNKSNKDIIDMKKVNAEIIFKNYAPVMITSDKAVFDKNNFKTELLHTCSQSGTQIFVIYTNKDFKDAGETFMGNYYNEQSNTIFNNLSITLC